MACRAVVRENIAFVGRSRARIYAFTGPSSSTGARGSCEARACEDARASARGARQSARAIRRDGWSAFAFDGLRARSNTGDSNTRAAECPCVRRTTIETPRGRDRGPRRRRGAARCRARATRARACERSFSRASFSRRAARARATRKPTREDERSRSSAGRGRRRDAGTRRRERKTRRRPRACRNRFESSRRREARVEAWRRRGT